MVPKNSSQRTKTQRPLLTCFFNPIYKPFFFHFYICTSFHISEGENKSVRCQRWFIHSFKKKKVVHSLLKLWTPTVRPWMLSILSQEILSSISPSNSTILRQLCNVPVGRWDLQQAGFRTTPGCPCPTETLRIYRKDKPSLGKGSEPAPVAVAQNSLNHSSAKLQDIRSICISGCAWTNFFREVTCAHHSNMPLIRD